MSELTPEQREAARATMDAWRHPTMPEHTPATIQALYRSLDQEATILLNALYDATGATDPEELQAWFDERVGGTDERYPENIYRLRVVLSELHRAGG